MGYLDDLKGKTIQVNGANLPDRKRLHITATGATASDSPGSDATVLDLTGLTFTDTTVGGGNPVMQVAPNSAVAITSLATASNVDNDFDPGADGVFRFSVMTTVKMATSGTYRTDDYVVIGVRSGGTMTLLGTPVQLGIGGDTTGLTTTITASGGGFRVNLANATGETVTGYAWASWAQGDLVS